MKKIQEILARLLASPLSRCEKTADRSEEAACRCEKAASDTVRAVESIDLNRFALLMADVQAVSTVFGRIAERLSAEVGALELERAELDKRVDRRVRAGVEQVDRLLIERNTVIKTVLDKSEYWRRLAIGHYEAEVIEGTTPRKNGKHRVR